MNNNETPKSDWNQLKSKIKDRFGKLTDEAIDSAKGNLDVLSGKIQHAYGYAKDQAEKELSVFKTSLPATMQSLAQTPEKPAVAELKPVAANA